MNTALKLVAILALISVIAGCGPGKVNRTSSTRFAHLAGRCYELKSDVFIVNFNLGRPWKGKYLIQVPEPPSSGEATSLDQLFSIPREKWRVPNSHNIEAILPKHTRIRIEKLTQEANESGTSLPYVVVLNGRFQGITACAYELFNDPDWPRINAFPSWTIKDEYLAPCTETAEEAKVGREDRR